MNMKKIYIAPETEEMKIQYMAPLLDSLGSISGGAGDSDREEEDDFTNSSKSGLQGISSFGEGTAF